MSKPTDERPRCVHGVVYPMDHCAECLRAALAAAEAKLADCRASVKVCDVCGEETSTWEGHALKAALADERRHADALLNALHNPDNITVERAIEAHHARRAAEVANG